MAETPKQTFVNLAGALGSRVATHKAATKAVLNHAQQHSALRQKKFEALKTQQRMMHDIPPGGIK